MGGNAAPDGRWQRLGEYIRVQRRMADLSLRQMAELTRVSNAYLSQVERGLHQPSIRVLRSIADALNLSADTLLTQAGLLGTDAPAAPARPGPGEEGTPVDTETAIRHDPALRPEDREALIRIYRSLRQGGARPRGD
ncbi:MAG TPA: helix-turn-helix transcriptional regulator [Kineosporiaceae bacterium]|nr:helix-turn-helix transcriptional regulator [Kineosporiaceae bacterium]